MCDDSVHSGLTTVSQFVPSIFLSVEMDSMVCPTITATTPTTTTTTSTTNL